MAKRGRKPGPQKREVITIDGRSLEKLETDFDLVVDGGSRILLRQKAVELQTVWEEVIRMNQLTDISLGFAHKNMVFVFKSQNVTVNIENMIMARKETKG